MDRCRCRPELFRGIWEPLAHMNFRTSAWTNPLVPGFQGRSVCTNGSESSSKFPRDWYWSIDQQDIAYRSLLDLFFATCVVAACACPLGSSLERKTRLEGTGQIHCTTVQQTGKVLNGTRLIQESPPQTKPKKGQLMNFTQGHSGTKVQCESCLFSQGKTPEFTKMGEIHELFVLPLSLV